MGANRDGEGMLSSRRNEISGVRAVYTAELLNTESVTAAR